MHRVHEAYERLASECPNSVAVWAAENDSFTYSTLCGRARDISLGIQELVPNPQMGVALITERNSDVVCVYVAASFAGRSLVPLPTWAEAKQAGQKRDAWERNLGYAVNEGNVQVIIADKEHDEYLGSVAIPVITVQDLIARASGTNTQSANHSHSNEVVLKLISGGSTGSPKLYSITHTMVLSELGNYQHIVGTTIARTDCRVLQQSPAVWPASQFGQLNIALALCGCAIIAPARKSRDIANIIVEKQVNVVGGTPPQLLAVSEYLTTSSPVRVMFVWGEALQKQTADKIYESVLEPVKGRLIELLIATEYWLCLFDDSRSGRFRAVPSCRISVIDADINGIGQLCIEGPMVMDGRMVTQDLVKQHLSPPSIEFVGRKDFMTKIGANWFDVTEIEKAVVEHGEWMLPRIANAVVVSHTIVISIETDVFPVDIKTYLSEIRSVIKRIAPVDIAIRIISKPLPRTVTGKLDRKTIVSLLDSVKNPSHVSLDKGKERLRKEIVGQSKWAAAFAAASYDYAPLVPYMYLASLYLPRSEYLAQSRVYSGFAALCYSVIDAIRKEFPFGVAGLIVLFVRMRRRSKIINRIVILWTLFGVYCAIKGKRLLSWPIAFWAGAGQSVRDEGQYWLRPRKWARLVSNIVFIVKSVPDVLLGTNMCASYGNIARTEWVEQKEDTESVITMDDNDKEEVVHSQPVEPQVDQSEADPVTEWWNKKTVDYITLVGDRSKKGETNQSENTFISSSSSVDEFVTHVIASHLGGIGADVPLKGISSLKITEMVQALRLRVPAVSARMIMDAETVDQLKQQIMTSLEVSSLSHAIKPPTVSEPREVRIQFSPGQVVRPCRWMIKSKKPIDRFRLKTAIDQLVDRHPLLRSELIDPKPFHSFLYDAGVMMANINRFYGGKRLSWIARPISRAVHAAWARLRIYASSKHVPDYWIDSLTESTVFDFEQLRRSIVTLKRDCENMWNTIQRPFTVHIFTLIEDRGTTEFVMLSVKHSVSDGNSAFPLLDELASLYENEALSPAADPIPELERRFKDGIMSNASDPDRTSLRTQIFYSKTVDQLGGGYYRHYLCFESRAIRELRQVALEGIQSGFDSLLLSIFIIALMRTDKKDKQTMTLYCPLRDGVNESGYIGLFADWRDLTVQALPGATVLDVIFDTSDKVRKRMWEPTVSGGGPESVLLNWLAFDGRRRLSDKSWEQYHVDKITQRWNKVESRDYDFNETPSGRFRSMSLEQYDQDGDWWLRFDVATKLFPPEWMMRFAANVDLTFNQILNNPLQPVLNDIVE